MKPPFPSTNRAWIFGILILLIGVNIAFSASSRSTGPLLGLTLYALILVLCWKKHDVRAAMIGGCIGFGVHVLEGILNDLSAFSSIDKALFILNIILPLPLALLGWRESRGG